MRRCLRAAYEQPYGTGGAHRHGDGAPEGLIAAEGKAPALDEALACFFGEVGELFAEYDDAGSGPLVRK